MDYATLELLSRQHPAWQLLRADHAPFVAAHLNRVFLEPNVRTLPEGQLIERGWTTNCSRSGSGSWRRLFRRTPVPT
jgi:hypothetical protein